ncbi:MAG TPA: hypothetical protein VF131_23515 [Blastocatellia bacterium]|nr:hypothetical protein [Blastocatellia bacterium]
MDRNTAINELSWLCTHNAYNSEGEIGTSAASTAGTNQDLSITSQLRNGVRAFMIDVHNFHNAPRVCHGVWEFYEDLCDLLIKYKTWLNNNTNEIIILMMEVANNVPATWIKDTFYGGGPITRSDDYNLKDLLYCHPDNSSAWPTINQLVGAGKRVIVFRETDEGKGVTGSDMEWYHDMWDYWIETPYGNSNWDDIQTHTYQLLRGNKETASFFSLNHFVNTGYHGSGSAGFAQGMNMDDYLTARALIAWRMQACRPTLSVDFFRSLKGAKPEDTYDTVATANKLNEIPSISGTISNSDGTPYLGEVVWTGVEDLNFKDNLKSDDYRVQSGSDGPGTSHPRSNNGTFSFPPNGYANNAVRPMILTPSCVGKTFTPQEVGWTGTASAKIDLKIS